MKNVLQRCRAIALLWGLLFITTLANAAPGRTITGTVTATDGNPLAGVSVIAENSTNGTVTDNAGHYAINVNDATTRLVFSLVGYQSVAVTITADVMNITLQQNAITADNVVVTGYTQTRRELSAIAAASVTAKEIQQVPLTPEQMLQGRIAGVNVTATTGQPGQSAKVVLRGVGTIIGSTGILYVVDGVPIENGYFQAINPEDIESMTVLKDAAAKALYGSRGSNGVIVITTKKGAAGRMQTAYQSQYGVAVLPSPKFQMMTGAEHLLFEEQVGVQTGSASSGPGWTYSPLNPANASLTDVQKARNAFILDSLRNINTDWRDYFFRRGKFMEQQLSLSGGNDKVRFYTSLNYYNQDGVAVRSGMKRVTLRNNLDITSGRFGATFNVSLGYAASSFIEAEGGSSGNNPLAAVYYALGYESPYYGDVNHTLVTTGNTKTYPVMDTREGSNALERLLNTSNKSNQFKTLVSAELRYEILKGLTAKSRVGVDFRNSLDQAFVNPDSYSGTLVKNGAKGSFGEAMRRNYNIVSTSGFTYASHFNNMHEVEVNGLFEYLYNQYRSFGYTGYGIDGRLPETPAGITPGSATGFIPTVSGGRTKSAMASFIGIGRYTLLNRYTVNLSYRYDGASTLSAKNRWHGFYSAGINWDVKREAFLQNTNVLSAFNIRASYGTTASPFPSDFGYLATYGTTTYGGETGIRPTSAGNMDYNWEYAEEGNIGFDAAFLRAKRIRLSMDIYNRKTKNLFFSQPQSITSGFWSNTVNIGSVQNSGIELTLNGDVIKTKDLTWAVGTNFAYNKNKILNLGGQDSVASGTSGILLVGKPLGTHYAVKWAGVDPQTGNPQYYDRTGAITTNFNAATMSVATFGTYLPKITGGFNTTINYKGIALSALFSYVTGVMRYNNEDYYNENPSFKSSNQSKRMLYDRWQKAGDIAYLPSITAKRSFSSKDIQDASYIRFRNLNISYNLPVKLLPAQKIISGARIFIQGENLYTWTKWRGFDPENGNEYNRFAYPVPRTLTAGINLNF